MSMPTIRPRFGYMLVIALENPFGSKTPSGIDVSPLVNASQSQWFEVVKVGRGPEGTPNPFYEEGDAVLLSANAVEMLVMAEKTIGLAHEGQIKASIKHGDYTPEYRNRDSLTIMDELRKRARQMQDDANGSGIVMPR